MEGDAREMEKPNLSGYSTKSFLSRVDLPVPLGPQMTMGRRRAAAAIVLVELKSERSRVERCRNARA